MKNKLNFIIILLTVLTNFASAQIDSRLVKNNKVYLHPLDKRNTEKIKNHVKAWGYWQVVDNRNEADFVLKFNCESALVGDKTGYAEFIDPKTNEIFETTEPCNTVFTLSGSKYSLAKKLIRKRIKPQLES
ncbi:MAG: hypothetical protein JNL72_06985 [Flavipsychrobacter sp.]|nr:hypothetical protein [Flavipsychrobacter sp.]